jgi:hypothetical protein
MLGNQTLFISCIHHYPPASPYVDAQQGLVFTARTLNMIGASLRLLSHVPELFIFIHLILSGSVTTIPSSMEMCPTTLPPKDYLI